MSQSIGKQAERLAADYLRQNRLAILATNYSCRWGEIDIIARDGDILVFIEVRYRRSSTYGDASETVGPDKQNRIIKTAQQYLNDNRNHADRMARFDLVSMTGTFPSPEIEWLKSAFIMQ